MAAQRFADVVWGGTKSKTRRICKMIILGTNDCYSIPIEVTTKVATVRALIAEKLGIDLEELSFIVKNASSYRVLHDCDEIRSEVVVKGISSWKRTQAVYPHPHCIIGAGHGGLRQALSYLKDGIHDFVIYDRISRLGGVAWVLNANPTSKLQTELGVYHLQYDKDYSIPRHMSTWPTRDELLEHFEKVSRDFGILSHVQLDTEVQKVRVVVRRENAKHYGPEKQCYAIRTRSTNRLPLADKNVIAYEKAPQLEDAKDMCLSDRLLLEENEEEIELVMQVEQTNKEEDEEVEANFSSVACYPGGLVDNIRMECRGEDVFLGQIGYGMFNEFDYNQVLDSPVVILGMGAFAVENVRTCLEHGASKVSLVCRRKNLAVPRVVDWFINQSLYPPTAAMILDAMKPMYDFLPEDPWDYYAVVASQDRKTATIRQKSRFGIGDFYFLASYYGKVEVMIDAIKRLRETTVVLESAISLPADHFIKVLGFTADQKIDNIFDTKEMVGFFANGDWRLWVCCEFPGIDAGRFGGTSFSPGGLQNSETMSWILRYPRDAGPVLDSNVLPRQRANKETGRPAYQWEPRAGSQIAMVLVSGIIPGLAELASSYGIINRAKMLEAHPMEDYIDECAEEWNRYCQMFKDRGDDRPFPEYPYTHEYMRGLCVQNDRQGEEEQAAMALRATKSELS